MIPIIYKNVLTSHLKIERHDLSEQYRAWGAIYAESFRFETHQANDAVEVLGKAIRLRIDAIDAELNLRRGMGLGTAPLSELTEAPTAIAS